MKNNYFDENIIGIIEKDGNIINIKKQPQELYHFQTFLRVASDYIPDLFDGLPLDPRAYTGYQYATLIAKKGYAIFVPASFSHKDVMILSLPKDISQSQKEVIESLLPQLFHSYLYILVCNNKKLDEDDEDIAYYPIPNMKEKRLESIKELEIINNNHKK